MPKSTTKADLRAKSAEELAEYVRTQAKKVLELRFQNFTNQLNDTSQIRKARRDLARALTVRTQAGAKQGDGK